MTCDACRPLLLRYLHGELPNPEAVERHVRECVSCRLHLHSERRVWDALGRFEVDVEPVDLLPRLQARIGRRARIARFARLAALAVVAIGIGLAFLVGEAPPRLEAVYPGDALMDRHTSETAREFPYVDGYDEAVAEGHYIAFVDPDAPVLRLADGSQRLYGTPRGTISVFAADGPAGRRTVLRRGREFKILTIGRHTFVSDQLPWPEIHLFAKEYKP